MLTDISVIHPAYTIPKIFGPLHLALLFICLAVSFSAAACFRNRDSVKVLRLSGYLLLVSEIFRQLFLHFFMNISSWWYFPFQLCSMPMYLCLLYPRMGNRTQSAVRIFLSSYTLIAALCALVYPQDMLTSFLPYTLNSFFWHGLMLFVSFFLIMKEETGEKTFREPVILFLFLAFLAEIINTAGYYASKGTDIPDMFYISPFTHTYQPFFSLVEKTMGKPVEIIVYLAVLSIAAYLVHCVTVSLRK